MNDKPKAGNMTFHAELLKLTQVQLCPAKLSRAISGSLLPKPLLFAAGMPQKTSEAEPHLFGLVSALLVRTDTLL